MVKITIAVNKVERVLEIDPDEIPMQFYADLEEAGETKKMTPIMHTYAAAIGFTQEEIGQISRKDFNRIVEALNSTTKDAGAIPNA